MRRLIRGLILAGVCSLLVASDSGPGQQTPVFIGVLMGIHENGETRCDFVFRTWLENDIYVSVPAWCGVNIDLITAVNRKAREWLNANPIEDPEALSKQQKRIEELRREGFEVRKKRK